MSRIHCPTCSEQNERSKAWQDPTGTYTPPGLAFVDQDGESHYHGARTFATYVCEFGHRWMQVFSPHCWACSGTDPQPDPDVYVLHDEGVRWL